LRASPPVSNLVHRFTDLLLDGSPTNHCKLFTPSNSRKYIPKLEQFTAEKFAEGDFTTCNLPQNSSPQTIHRLRNNKRSEIHHRGSSSHTNHHKRVQREHHFYGELPCEELLMVNLSEGNCSTISCFVMNCFYCIVFFSQLPCGELFSVNYPFGEFS
jgi:hypothetical protein